MRTVIIVALVILAMLTSCERMSRSGNPVPEVKISKPEKTLCVVQRTSEMSINNLKYTYKVKVISNSAMFYTSSYFQYEVGDTIFVDHKNLMN